MKLGKRAARRDSRTLLFSNYFRPTLPVPPTAQDWGKAVPTWGMMANDSVGDCTCAAAGHLIMGWTANEGNIVTPQDTDILAAYSALTGYDPATGLNDNGAAELDVLNFWRTAGIAGHKISAFASLQESNRDHVMLACWIFGGCYIGLSLPSSAQNQEIWDVGSPAGSWGGHAVPIVGYNSVGPVCVTWGATKQMTWAFYFKYCDEAYAVLGPEWTGDDKKAPNGFDLSTLIADLRAVAK